MFKVLTNKSNASGYNLYPSKENFVDIERNKIYQIYTTNYLQELGFNEIVLRKQTTREKYKSPYMQIEILLNPKKIISDNSIEITEDKDIIPITNKFNEIVHDLDAELPNFFNWTLKRIDYAINIKTPYVKEYVKLFQRGDKPSKYYKEAYDKRLKRRTQREGSFYLYCKGTAINFYDKQKERIDNKDKYRISNEDIIKSKNILRIEVQCNKDKTDYLKYQRKFKTKNVSYYLTLEESNKEILGKYEKCIKCGDYYTLKGAKAKIDDNKELSTRVKNTLKDTLDLINRCRSIADARKNFKDEKQTFNKHLRTLNELDINPVTIPERWGISFLDNPIKEIDDQR